MKVSELNEDQRSHLIWRIDAKTGCGLGWARAVAECRGGEAIELKEVFIQAGKTPRSAAYHARKVVEYVIDPVDKLALKLGADFTAHTVRHSNELNLSLPDTVKLARAVANALSTYADTLEDMAHA